MKLSYKIDFERDVENWQKSISTTSYGLAWKKFLPEDFDEKCLTDEACLRNYIQTRYYKNRVVDDFRQWLETNVNIDQIQSDIASITDEIVDLGDMNIYLTTFHRAPYNFEKSYFYSICRPDDKPRSITSIYHELFHFYFHKKYFAVVSEIIGATKAHILKESLTVLLNDTLAERSLPEDKGYPEHQKLRTMIADLWYKRNSLDDIVQSATRWQAE